MEQHALGSLWPVSTLTLGGGGLGRLWGADDLRRRRRGRA